MSTTAQPVARCYDALLPGGQSLARRGRPSKDRPLKIVMPYFDENPLQKLAQLHGSTDHELDLRGKTTDEALQAVEALLHAPNPADSYLVRFDPASDDGRETLFLPLGRRLLQARRDGHIKRCLPSADGAAYFVAFKE